MLDKNHCFGYWNLKYRYSVWADNWIIQHFMTLWPIVFFFLNRCTVDVHAQVLKLSWLEYYIAPVE